MVQIGANVEPRHSACVQRCTRARPKVWQSFPHGQRWRRPAIVRNLIFPRRKLRAFGDHVLSNVLQLASCNLQMWEQSERAKWPNDGAEPASHGTTTDQHGSPLSATVLAQAAKSAWRPPTLRTEQTVVVGNKLLRSSNRSKDGNPQTSNLEPSILQ